MLGHRKKEAMTDTTSTATAPDRDAIRADLEATKASYHELLNSLSDEDWKKKSANPTWNVRQLMWHIAWVLGYFPGSVERCRKEKGMNLPTVLMNPVNTLITRVGSRGSTRQAVADKYDQAHITLLASLDEVQDHEWQKGVKSFGTYNTVESIFSEASKHFQEHQTDILKGLGRA